MPNRKKPEMKERILASADRLFYGTGIRAVGVDAVAAEAGVSKRTLYDYFPSKDHLIVAYLSRRLSGMPASDAPLAEQILSAFDRLERTFLNSDFRGCPFVNAVAEIGERTHPATAIAADFKEQRRVWFRDLLVRLNVENADALSMQLAILLDGALALALVRADPSVARSARDAARTLLESANVRLSSAKTVTEGRRRHTT